MKLKKRNNTYEWKNYIIKEINDQFHLISWSIADDIDFGLFPSLDDAKKEIRRDQKRIKEIRTCVHCGYEKSQHKAQTYNCPYSAKQFNSFHKDQFFLSKKESKSK